MHYLALVKQLPPEKSSQTNLVLSTAQDKVTFFFHCGPDKKRRVNPRIDLDFHLTLFL